MASTIAAGTTSGTAIAIAGDTSGVLQLQTNGTTAAVTINTSQQVLVGTTTSTNNIRLNQKIAVTTAGSGNYGGVSNTSYNGTTASTGPIFDMQRSRGTTDGSMTAVASGDTLGYIVFRGSDGTSFQDSSFITGQVDDTVGSGSVPGRLVFNTNNAERMRILSDGKVCIGITTAQQSAMLSVTSGANNTSIALKGDSGTNCGSIRYTSATTGNNCWQIASNENNFFIFDADASHYAFLGQDPTAWFFGSDARIKKDIIDLPYGLATILAVQPRRFAYISDGKEDIGFIAQELQAVVPEAVVGEEIPFAEDDEPMERASKTMGVSKDKLIPILVKALQELNAKVEAQAVRIAELEGAK